MRASGSRSLPFAEGEITRIRRETKILVEPDEAERIAAALALRAAPRVSRIACVYFDTAERKLARRAVSTPDDCVKVRTKSYDPDAQPHEGLVVLDVKRERRGTTSKDRRWLAPEEVPEAVRTSLEPVFGRLAPTIASSYRRRVFQCSPSWRVTIDDDLRFHLAEWALFAPDRLPWHASLARAFAAEPRTVIELKHAPGALPPWLDALGRARGTPYSKFTAGASDEDRAGSSPA